MNFKYARASRGVEDIPYGFTCNGCGRCFNDSLF